MGDKDKEKQSQQNISQLIWETNMNKFELIPAAVRWAKEIKKREQLPDNVSALLDRAMDEILTGKVKMSEIEKLVPLREKEFTPEEERRREMKGMITEAIKEKREKKKNE